jgi:hypothetical protein
VTSPLPVARPERAARADAGQPPAGGRADQPTSTGSIRTVLTVSSNRHQRDIAVHPRTPDRTRPAAQDRDTRKQREVRHIDGAAATFPMHARIRTGVSKEVWERPGNYAVRGKVKCALRPTE